MKHSDFKKLFNLGLMLSRQLPKIHFLAIQDFVLGLHGTSVKVGRLNLSIRNIQDVEASASHKLERNMAITKGNNHCEKFNMAIIATYGAVEGYKLAKFFIEASDDPAIYAIKLHHPQWEMPFFFPCSQ